jgi:AcrR family transcriptional regulator
MTAAQPARSLRQEQTALTSGRILEAAAAAIAEDGPSALSLGAVAARAGISERTLYRHFANKRELIEGLVRWVYDEVARDFSPAAFHSPADIVASIRPSFEQLDRLKDFYAVLQMLPEATDAMREDQAVRRDDVSRGMEPVTSSLPEERRRAIVAVAHLLTSSRALYFLQQIWDMDSDEAAAACAWAVEVVAAAAEHESEER